MTNPCIDNVFKALNGKVQRKTIESWIEDIEKKSPYDPATLMPRLIEMGKERIREAYIRRRNTALALQKETNFYGYVISQFKDDPVKGIMAYLGGVQSYKKGSRLSAAAHQENLQQAYLSDLETRIKRAGLWNDFRSGELDEAVTRELYDMSQDKPTGKATESKTAKAIAKIVRDVQERARIRANAAGADIGKLQGYVTAQTHDMFKLRRAGEDAWVDSILPKLDRVKTFGDAKISDIKAKEILRDVYGNLASGDHMKVKYEPPALSHQRPSSNIGGSISKERLLHFKTVEDTMDYNTQFGRGNLRENVVDTLVGLSKKTALMEVLGPNPQEIIDRVYARLRDDLGSEAKIKLAEKRATIDKLMATIDGSASVPGNATAAKWWQIFRHIQSMARLGGAVVSALSDIPLAASELRYQGQGVLSPYHHAVVGAFNNIPRGSRRELASMLGIYNDGAIHSLTDRFSGEQDFSGKAGRAMVTFFKVSGLTDWTDRMRINISLAMSHRLGFVSDLEYSALDDDLKRTLGLFNIEEKEWSVLRKAIDDEGDKKFVTPEAVSRLSDSDMKKAFPNLDPDAARQDLADKLRSYFIDRTNHAVIMPDARTKALLRQGTRPGTVDGEFFRLITQFKAFPFAVLQKTLGRTLYGKEEFGASGFAELTHMIAMTTAFGYMAMTAKDILKGKEPRDPLQASTIMAAMMQGGALGIYGDFILGTSNRFGGGLIETAAGPGIGTIADAGELLMSIRDGDDPRAKSLRFLQGNTPFANLFYLRAALDYGIMYRLQESLNPGYLRRMEARVERDNKQEFLLRPSDVIPYGGG